MNEEKYIEVTLRSIKNQNFKDFEVIVCDCHSNDKTAKIAKKYADKIVFTKTKSISSARNTGANFARGDNLFFIDADTTLPRNYLEKVCNIFKLNKYVGFCSGFKFSNKSLKYKISEKLVNLIYIIFDICRKTVIPGFNFCIPKSIFEEIGGFENVFVEDVDLFKKINKLGKTKYFTHFHVTTSSRRLEKQGILKTLDYYCNIGRKWNGMMDFSKRYIKVD